MITNILSGTIKTVVKEADITYDHPSVSVEFNNGEIVVWNKNYLEILDSVDTAIPENQASFEKVSPSL